MKTCVSIGVLSLACSILSLKAQPVLFQGAVGTVSTAAAASAASTADIGRQAGAAGTTAGKATDTALATVQLSEVNVQGQKRHPLPPMVPKFSALSVQDIQQAGVQNLQDILRSLPGVDIRSRGPENVQADVLLRGGTFDQAAVLLDGVDLSDPQTGHHILNLP
ncbi:MAG: Plug domain-containing protein, partial [Bacteroidales bacterium]|nr:Plug domain-containing protein [Bacteroidales bacterium]